jgi:hypothetical protein
MKIRENLISDIESFIPEAIKLYNAEKIVKKSEYVNLESRISSLNKNDFESEEKHKNFLKYYNQAQRRIEKKLLENEFIKDYLETGNFLWMCNYFSGIVNWMK